MTAKQKQFKILIKHEKAIAKSTFNRKKKKQLKILIVTKKKVRDRNSVPKNYLTEKNN